MIWQIHWKLKILYRLYCYWQRKKVLKQTGIIRIYTDKEQFEAAMKKH